MHSGVHHPSFASWEGSPLMTVSPSESHAEFSISFRPLANDDLPFLLR